MARFQRCEECGVPETFANERRWLNSGVVVQRGNEMQRTGFIDCDNLGPLYDGIADIIGMPVDRLILESTRKGADRYVEGLLPPGIQEMIKNNTLTPEAVIATVIFIAELAGYGKVELKELSIDPERAEGEDFQPGDHLVILVQEPFCIAPVAGIFAGSCEAATKQTFMVDYREAAPDAYEMTSTVEDYIDEYEGRFQPRDYHHREGDVELPPCPTCGVPKALSTFTWHDDRGVIVDNLSGRRVVGVGTYVTDRLFEELEYELGDAIPRAVVEAQRRFIKTGFYNAGDIRNPEEFCIRFAVKGMGNVRDLGLSPRGLRMRVDNADCYLMTVGLAQALFEMDSGVDSNVEWELSPEGDLELQVSPRT